MRSPVIGSFFASGRTMVPYEKLSNDDLVLLLTKTDELALEISKEEQSCE
jgi:hypothetical protein